MEPVPFIINSEGHLAFSAPFIYELCGHFRKVIEDSGLLPPAYAGRKGVAAFAISAPHEARPTTAPLLNSAGPQTPAAPKSRGRQAPPPARTSAAPRSAHPAPLSTCAEAVKPCRTAQTGASAIVLRALEVIKEGDIRAILDQVEAQHISIDSEEPEKTIANALYQTLKPKGLVERVDGKRGVWKLAA